MIIKIIIYIRGAFRCYGNALLEGGGRFKSEMAGKPLIG